LGAYADLQVEQVLGFGSILNPCDELHGWEGTALPYISGLNTIVETQGFSRKVASLWSLEDYEDFKVFISANPTAGKVIPGTGGLRKIRWRGMGVGKRGGTRVIYFNNTAKKTWLLALYAKSNKGGFSLNDLVSMRREVDG